MLSSPGLEGYMVAEKFESFLFGAGKEIIIDDTEFYVNWIIMIPKIHPHRLQKVLLFSIGYCKVSDFLRVTIR